MGKKMMVMMREHDRGAWRELRGGKLMRTTPLR